MLMRPCKHGSKNQEWAYDEIEGLISIKGGNVCLDAAQYSTDGGEVQTLSCNASIENQLWGMSAENADADASDASPASALLDASISRKKPSAAVPATCDMNRDFTEQRGAWCYKDCPFGEEAAGTRCKTACMGEFPAKSPLMCGRSGTLLAAAFQEMAARTLMAGVSIGTLVPSVGLAAGLQGTLNSLIEMGLGFAHPQCPEFGEESQGLL